MAKYFSTTILGHEVTVEFYEESGEQRSRAFVMKDGYSASLEWAERVGTMTRAVPGMKGPEEVPLDPAVTERARDWAASKGY